MSSRIAQLRSSFVCALVALGLCRTLSAATTPSGPIDLSGRAAQIQNVGVTEHPGAQIPVSARFINENGQELPLSAYQNKGRPIVLQIGYFECPMLCGMVSQGLIESVKQMGLKGGKDFDMLFVSVDPSETPSLAALKHQSTMRYYGHPDEAGGFHFLVGRQDDIKLLTSTVGFGYEYMPDTQQFAHPAVLIVLTPEGKVSRYLYGVRYNQQTVRLSLVEASAGKIGSTVDKILLICLHYDAATGKYAWFAINLMRVGGLITVLCVGGTMLWFFRREKYRLV